MALYGAAGAGAIEAIASMATQATQASQATDLAALANAAATRAQAGAELAGLAPTTFGSLVTEALKQVNNSAITADTAVRDLALGREKNVHHVMIALEEASLSLQFAMAVRNKVIEAYQEVSRMQI